MKWVGGRGKSSETCASTIAFWPTRRRGHALSWTWSCGVLFFRGGCLLIILGGACATRDRDHFTWVKRCKEHSEFDKQEHVCGTSATAMYRFVLQLVVLLRMTLEN